MHKLLRQLAIGPFLFGLSAHAQSVRSLQGDWLERPPIVSQEELNCANRRTDSAWRISLRAGSLETRQLTRAEEDVDTVRIQFPDGELVGLDRGEWGGDLSWHATSGAPVPLIADNTSQLFVWSGGVFAAGGLAHLGLSEGYIARLERVRGSWRVAYRTDISAPVAAVDASSRDEVVLVTPDGVYAIDVSGRVTKIFSSANWWAQYPNSVVRLPDGDILVGMRYSISRLRSASSGYAETLIVPAQCPALVRTTPRQNCTCASS